MSTQLEGLRVAVLLERGVNEEALVRDGNLLSCQGTEDLPVWGRAWLEMM